MSDLLEHVLHDTFEKRAAQLDPQIRRRLMAVDYRPRRRRRIRVLPAVGVAGLAGAAAAVIAIVTLGSSAPPAFAGWTSVPTPARPGQTATALAECHLGRPVLIDTRGPFTASVFARRGGVGTCLNGPKFSGASMASRQLVTVRPGQIEVFEQTAAGGGSAATMLDGRIGRGVTGVRINLSNGRRVTATVAHGWYLAWWPGPAHATTAEIRTGPGAQTVKLPASARVGAGSCGASADTACASVGPGSSVGTAVGGG